MPAKAPGTMRSAEPMLKELGAQIRARRKQMGISAAAAAESAGISRVTWYRVEKGEPSVAVAAYANAARALGMVWQFGSEKGTPPHDSAAPEGWLPARIPVASYPELRKLAWQVSDGGVLTPREALSIYERNARHLDMPALTPRERALIAALRIAFGHDV